MKSSGSDLDVSERSGVSGGVPLRLSSLALLCSPSVSHSAARREGVMDEQK